MSHRIFSTWTKQGCFITAYLTSHLPFMEQKPMKVGIQERVMVVLCCSMIGKFSKTLIIGKSRQPRCFNITWRYNKKAWMTSVLFTEWIYSLSYEMQCQQRKILLFLDNAPSHPKDVKLTHIKVLFFPANSTSKLQPLDQGIIQTILN